MGQEDIYELLKSEKNWLNASQIAEKLKLSQSTISENLRRMRKYDKNLQVQFNLPSKGGCLYKVVE
jgi:predicted transcriptional regulator